MFQPQLGFCKSTLWPWTLSLSEFTNLGFNSSFGSSEAHHLPAPEISLYLSLPI